MANCQIIRTGELNIKQQCLLNGQRSGGVDVQKDHIVLVLVSMKGDVLMWKSGERP